MEVKSCINFLLSASQHTVFKHFSNALAQYKVTPAQYGVLNCLWEKGNLSPKQIREILLLEASSVSGILDRMQKLDLIDRTIDPNNRRTIIVSPTDKANALRPPIESLVERMNHKYLQDFSPEEKDLLKKALIKIIDIGQ